MAWAPEKTIAHTALVLSVPVTLIMPDAVMVALPLACAISALWLGPFLSACVTAASFANRVTGASTGLGPEVLEPVTALTTVASGVTWTPGPAEA